MIDFKPLSPQLQELVADARAAVVLASGMFGYQLYRCNVYATDSPHVQTAAAMVTGTENRILLNENFFTNVLKCTGERSFVLLHEVLHIFLDHFHRCKDGNFDPMLYNVAADYYINLAAAGAYGERGGKVSYNDRYKCYFKIPQIGIKFDEKYIGMSTEEIYKQILEDNDNDVDKAKQSELGSGDEEDGQGSGQPNGGGKDLVGDMMDGGGQGEGECEEAIAVQRNKNKQTAIASVMSATEGNGVGSNEAEFVRMFYEQATPKINWQDQLASLLTSSVKERPTYNRLSRRTQGSVVFPTYYGNRLSLVYGIDSSGSMSTQCYTNASTELRGILDQFDAWEVDLVTCDVKAHQIGLYDSEEDGDFLSDGLKIIGGGGTELTPIVEYANERNEEEESINACIVITDGYFEAGELDSTFSDEMINIVVITETGNKDIQFENAEVIYM